MISRTIVFKHLCDPIATMHMLSLAALRRVMGQTSSERVMTTRTDPERDPTKGMTRSGVRNTWERPLRVEDALRRRPRHWLTPDPPEIPHLRLQSPNLRVRTLCMRPSLPLCPCDHHRQ